LKRALSTLLLVLVTDQVLKIWVKLNFSIGESIKLFGFDQMQLSFVENPGMAFGLEFGGLTGKLVLSIFRLVASVGIGWYLWNLIKNKEHKGLVTCVALVLAGAVGNIIDSAFYGFIFDRGMSWNPAQMDWIPYAGTAKMGGAGYTSFLMGHVVDMLYFPLIDTRYPEWVPWVGGDRFIFFRPVFNIADASITVGILWIILHQRRYFPVPDSPEETEPSLEEIPALDQIKA